MAAKVIAGKTVQLNDEGYMTNPDEWTREIAECIAIEEGIPELTAEHWKVIEYCRKTAAENGGSSPTLRTITTNAGVTTKELFSLFPKGPAKKIARIAGRKKPEGCV